MSIYLIGDVSNIPLAIKGYIASRWDNEEGELLVLVKHHDKFEWLSIADCLPACSERDYPIELCAVTNINGENE